MKTFAYVEDYLEVINGDRDIVSGKPYGLFSDIPPIVSLARYDVQILSSMSASTLDGKSLTDKQAELAVKIILKYRKQLEKLQIDVSPVETPKFRLGIRQIDRRRLLYVENDHIVLKFPYDTKLIDNARELSKISEGSWSFDASSRVWKLAITETNVVAANGFARNHEFEVDPGFEMYLQAVLDCEKTAYSIQLKQAEDKLVIENAHDNLVEAINNFCGFHISNLNTLVDNSSIYGYTIEDKIAQDLCSKYSPRIYNLMIDRECKFAPNGNQEVYQDVATYAELTGRYPIYVYEPDLSDRLYNSFVKEFFSPDDVHRVKDLKKEIPTVHKKIIYFNKYKANWDQPIPLLISGHGMMLGGEKSLLLQQAEKVVYFATEIYNNKKQTRY